MTAPLPETFWAALTTRTVAVTAARWAALEKSAEDTVSIWPGRRKRQTTENIGNPHAVRVNDLVIVRRPRLPSEGKLPHRGKGSSRGRGRGMAGLEFFP